MSSVLSRLAEMDMVELKKEHIPPHHQKFRLLKLPAIAEESYDLVYGLCFCVYGSTSQRNLILDEY